MVTNITQLKILTKIMHSDRCRYTDMQPENESRDLYNYHLKELIKKGYLRKAPDHLYELTQKGRNFVALLHDDASMQKQFKHSIYVWPIRIIEGKPHVYMFKRLKHPHYGYTGAISIKMKYGEKIEKVIKDGLKHEIGMVAGKVNLLGVIRQIFQNEKGDIVADGTFYSYIVTEFEGEPKKKGIEGEYFWVELDKVLGQEDIFKVSLENMIPPIKQFLQDSNSYKPFVLEFDSGSMRY